MKCSKCGSDNLEKAKFCIECGQKIEVPCPKCGVANTPASKFCFECGHNLTLPSEPTRKELSVDQKLEKIHIIAPVFSPN